MKQAIPLLLSLSFLLHLSCNKREIETPNTDFGYDYYPLNVGQFWEYTVDSIIYRPAIGGIRKDTFHSFLREIVVDTFRDNTQLLNFRVEQFTRRSADLPWQIRNVFTMARDEINAFRVEDNLRFVKMVFPVKVDKHWSGTNYFDELTEVVVGGNKLEMFKGWESTIMSDSETVQTGGLGFDAVLKIQIADFNSFIESREGVEYYAKNVGLVSRSIAIFDTQCQICCNGDCGDLAWEDKVEEGFRLEQRLIRHN
ncbi:MAG: hypothetical protein R2828_26685 [Saprospiraceae bacterium]